jgi:hypothetical protein
VSSTPTGLSVDVADIPQTRALLARFEPDLLKRLDSELTAIAVNLKRRAQSYIAVTGVTGTAYRVLTRTRQGRFSKSVTTARGHARHWGDAPGQLAAIFEFANGVRDAEPQNVQRTRSLIDTLNARYGKPGRFLWAAWDDRAAADMAAVDATVKAVEAEYSARLSS